MSEPGYRKPSKPAAPKGRSAEAEKAFHEEAGLGKVYDRVLLGRLWPFVAPYKLGLLLSLATLPVSAELLVRQPLLMRSAIDQGVLRRDTAHLDRTAGLLLVLLLLEFGVRFVQMYAMQNVGQRVMADLRRELFAFLHRQRLAFFDRQPVGRLVTRVTNDVDALGELFASGALTAIGDLYSLVRIVIAMLMLSPELSLFAFVAVPPLALFVDLLRRRMRESFRTIRTKTARMNAYLNEQVSGVAVVQAFGQQKRSQSEFDEINEAYRQANQSSIRYDAMLFAVVEMFASVCVGTLLWVGAQRAGLAHGAASLGLLVAFVQYIQRFFEPMRDLSGKYTILQSAMAGAERIFGLLDSAEPDATRDSSRAATPAEGAPHVRFDHVDFGYGDKPVLRDVSFGIKRGSTVALVGATGAGKTTVLSLLQRLYEVDGGAIEMDGVDLRAMERSALRARFAVVPQEGYLFPGDVLRNIALGEADPDLKRAEECARRVGLDRVLARRGAGLDARVDERGANFSAGERQLIALARALYREPEVLLLDEATASVDSESEALVQEAIAEAIRGRTALVIAHRLSTIQHADLILVFHRGALAEQGTHQELLARGGIYSRLHRLQFGDDAE